MAWMIIPEPGGEFLCAEPCNHLDCAAYRREAKWECPLCKKPLGHGVKVTRYGGEDDLGTPALSHWICALKDLEKPRGG